jgi:hypothetical protein
MTDCAVPDCSKSSFCRSYCRTHYERWKRYGDPLFVKKAMSERGTPMKWLLEHRLYDGKECLTWPFAKFPDGRAHMRAGKPTRIMCELRNGLPPTTIHEAAHSCGNGHKACVNPTHLYWATSAENAQDRETHGTVSRGESHGGSKLTVEAVKRIREEAQHRPKKELAAEYGVSPSVITKVVRGYSWRHV